jgi:hypothetical protein
MGSHSPLFVGALAYSEPSKHDLCQQRRCEADQSLAIRAYLRGGHFPHRNGAIL